MEGVEIVKIVAFFILSLVYARRRSDVVLLFAPLFVAVLLVGGGRVNMLGYMVFLGYGLKINGGVNWGVFLTSLYFAYGAIGFVSDVLEHGSGFL